MGDAEKLIPKSSSHISNKSSRSSGSSGRRRRRSNASPNLSERSSGSRGSRRSPPHRQSTDPLPEGSSHHGFSMKKSASADGTDDYLVGYGTDTNSLPPIPSTNTSYHSGQSSSMYSSDNSGSNNSMQMGTTSETDRSVRSNKSSPLSTVHSGKSYRSSRRNKLKREERRRKFVQKWRRRRLLGTMILTSVSSLLFAYTLLVTLGPLALYHFYDEMEWCPYYHDEGWLEPQHEENEFQQPPDYSLNIDQLQQSRQGGNREHQRRRRLSSDGVTYLTNDLKEVEINLLRKTSKDVHSDRNEQEDSGEESKYENPDYNDSPCHTMRIPFLFYLTLEECDLSRRMATSVLLGGLIGYERRASDRPAGIRTMSLVSLGSCFFTISSQLAFRDSPMTWDSSRVTAAIPSGVGFLGAGLIWKGSLSDGSGGEVHQVHGITTAAR